MTNKTTKSALFTSSISLLLCFAMLIGTTFAWFTDSVTSANNIIKSGNLDVEFEYWDGDSWETVQGVSDILAYENWEPGYTEVAYLRVANKGSLALKYQLGVNIVSEKEGTNVAGDTFKLSDSLMFGIIENKNGETDAFTKDDAGRAAAIAALTDAKKINVGYSEEFEMARGAADDYFALVVYMPTTVGNEANHDGSNIPQIDLGINVYATQMENEEDSFNNEYDKNATYELSINDEGKYETNSIAGLSKIAELASANDTITEAVYVDVATGVKSTVPVASSSTALDEAIGNDNSIVILTSGDYTVDNAKNSDVTIVGNGDSTTLAVEGEGGGGEANVDYGLEGANVIFENMTIAASGTYAGYARIEKATYNNCTIKGVSTLYGESIFNNCTFDLSNDYVWTWGAPYAEFNNCTFENSDGKAKAILVHNTVDTEIIVNNCEFIATTAASTWDGIPVSAVSIDPATTGKTATVRFVGTNTVSSAFHSLYQVKYANEVADVTIYVNGEKVAVTAMK